jgi:hypothetical protein
MTITRAETDDAWRDAGTIQFTESDLAEAPLPETSKRTLVAFSLPSAVDMIFSAISLARVDLPGRGAVTIFGSGWNDEYLLYVLPGSATVRAYHPHVEEDAYVNAGLEEFVEFLARTAVLYRLYREADGGQISKEQYLNAVSETRSKLTEADRKALTDDGWWSAIIDEATMI